MGRFIDLAGKRFGRLVVVRRSKERASDKHIRWDCQCDCGSEAVVIGHLMRYGLTKSCGCLSKQITGDMSRTHGRSKTRTYRIWKGMRRRCNAPSAAHFEYYGGRGISVHPRWETFENFLEDMGECPAGSSLDRVDNSKNYEPGNCRWATIQTQARNMRSNRLIEYRGEVKCLAEWAEITGLHTTVISGRLSLGWEVGRALFTPSRGRKRVGQKDSVINP